MKLFRRIATRFSYGLDYLARLAIFLLMSLVISNVILRFFGSPVRGTVEWVEFLTAMVIGLSLSYCAVQGGHIAVGLLVDKLERKMQLVISIFINLVSFLFLLIVFWRIISYADSIRRAGQVSLTTGTPYYPFIIIIAIGFLAYSLIIMADLLDDLKVVQRK